jgi:hypothetical protein
VTDLLLLWRSSTIGSSFGTLMVAEEGARLGKTEAGDGGGARL